MIDLRLFASVQFSGAIAAAVGTFALLGGFLFLTALYLQDARGLSPVAAGLHIAPMAAAVALMRAAGRARRPPPDPGRDADRRDGADRELRRAGHRRQRGPRLVPGGRLRLFGSGIGAANEPITYAAVSGLPPPGRAWPGGINSSSRMVGQVLGVAIAGAVLMANLHGPMRTGFGPAASAAWCVLTCTGYAVLLAGILATGSWAAATADRAAAAAAARQYQPGRGSRAARQVLAPPAGRHAVPRARPGPGRGPGARAAQARPHRTRRHAMTLNADAGPAQAGATYTAWPLSELPEWMLADAPGQAAWLVVREPGAAIGWIQAPCRCAARTAPWPRSSCGW